MSRYAKVVAGEVASVGALPKNLNNISGFNKLSDAEVLEFGFYPFTLTMPTVNYLAEKLGAIQYTINADTVSATYAVVALSTEELASKKTSFEADCSAKLVESLYKTDWIGLANNGLSAAEETRYVDYRANLKSVRDALSTFTLAQLDSLSKALQDCEACICSRFTAFSAPMIALETLLVDLLTA